MKTLLLIRHTKASWQFQGLTDFERMLNDKGRAQALEMAQKLFNEDIKIDQFITSSALRAFETCKIFTEVYNIPYNDIVEKDKLYNSAPMVFYEIIKKLEDKHNCVAIFAHNPGITEMACTQVMPMEFIDMPTCGVYAVKADINSWQDYEEATKEKLFFKYPAES
jgi:phosphohistidine phosphatase